jgi:hypothetical protein
MNTWDKKVTVNGKHIPKKQVLRYYKNLWKNNRRFRDTLKKNGIFVRASYGTKSVIRRKNISIGSYKDLEKVIHEHGVEFIAPTKNVDKNVIDIDMPKKYLPKKRRISRSVVNALKKKGIKISLITDSPNGSHIFSKSTKPQIKKALSEIALEDKDKKFHVGKSSKHKIVLDPSEPNVAIPHSLSIKGKPYNPWK